MKISTILDKIDDKQLFVPAFQREYVWKREDAKQLIDSLIKEYPTGTMLTWETTTPPELKGPYKYDKKQGSVRLLLDGQQRITTLYMLICGAIPPYYTSPEIKNKIRGLYVNLQTMELSYYLKSKMEGNPYWQDITDVFQKKITATGVREKLEEQNVGVNMTQLERIIDNINKITLIKEREFPEQTIPVKANIREAIDIFYKVNASGVALTDAELALAQITGYWPEARDLIKSKLSSLASQGFVFKLDFIIYALLGCMYYRGSEMQRLHGAENLEPQYDQEGHLVRDGIREVWKKLNNYVLDYVMNLMRSKAYVDHTDEVNSVYAFIPIIVFCYSKHGDAVPEQQLWRIVKWFYYSQIRSRYVSQLPQKLDFDLRIVKEADYPFEELIGVIAEDRGLEIKPDEFSGRSISHPLFGLMKWYLKSIGATCFTTGLGLHKNMGEKYQLENDHVFPSALLKKHGYGRGNRLKYALAQEMTNRAILTQVANRKKSSKSAEYYLKDVYTKSPEALRRQCIPLDQTLWSIEKYEEFLSARRGMLSKSLNKYLNGLAVEKEEEYGAATLEELIAEGENEELEFKSSLRWDYVQGAINKKLEAVVVKTIVAFGNSEGGTLLIGINDEGIVLGLDNDFASLNADKDRFEIHLRNILKEYLGAAFVASHMKVSFPRIEDAVICKVDVLQSNEPLFMTIKDKNGVAVEKIYVRSGNSSHELSRKEFELYRKGRFE